MRRSDQANPGSDGVPTKSAGFPVEIVRQSAEREAQTPEVAEVHRSDLWGL